jgi:hypothetical protein
MKKEKAETSLVHQPTGSVMVPADSEFGKSIIEQANKQAVKRFETGVISQVELIQSQIRNNERLMAATQFAIEWYNFQLAAIAENKFRIDASGRIIFHDRTLNFANADDAMREREPIISSLD